VQIFVPFSVTLNDPKVICLLENLSNAIRRTFVHSFNWHGMLRGPSAIAELLVSCIWDYFLFVCHTQVNCYLWFCYCGSGFSLLKLVALLLLLAHSRFEHHSGGRRVSPVTCSLLATQLQTAVNWGHWTIASRVREHEVWLLDLKPQQYNFTGSSHKSYPLPDGTRVSVTRIRARISRDMVRVSSRVQ